MFITLFKNISDNNVINKNISDPLNLQGNYKDKVNIIALSLILKFNGICDYNYCFVKDLGRYYFINNITYYPNNIISLDLSIDVLMSYKDDILYSDSEIRSLDNFNSYTNDGYLSETKKDIEIYKSDTELELENNNIMIVVSN